MLEYLTPFVKPVPNQPGIYGHGEGFDYKGKTFYYRTGKYAPKNKVFHLTWEGNYLGRTHGEKEYLIVAWNNRFVLLDYVFFSSLRTALAKYDGLSCKEAIAKKEKEELQQDNSPKCSCGGVLLVLHTNQLENECYTCFLKRTGER